MNFGYTGDFASTRSIKPSPKSLKIANKTLTSKNSHDKLQLYFIRYKQNPLNFPPGLQATDSLILHFVRLHTKLVQNQKDNLTKLVI